MNAVNQKRRLKAKRRRHGLPPIVCPECGAGTRLVTAGEVFKRGIPGSIRELLACEHYPACDCYVAINRKLQRYGLPANRKVRRLRYEAHKLQEQILRAGIMERGDLYKDMGRRYGLRPSRAHIRYFDETMCRRVIRDYRKILLTERDAA